MTNPHSAGRLISTREAAEILGEIGIPRETARRALLTGIAGPPQRLRGAVLYDGGSVSRLASKPALTEDDLPAQMRSGTFVARLGAPGTVRGIDLTAPRDEQLATVTGPWRISLGTAMVVWARNLREWPMPFVGTITGIAVLGAHAIAVTKSASTRGRASAGLQLVEPGDWYDEVHLRRLPIAPRGAPWSMIPAGSLTKPGLGPV